MNWPASFFFPHSVKVRDMTPGGGMGPTPGAARTLSAEVIDRRVIVKARDGQEVVSNSRVTVPLTANVAVGALVTVWPGTNEEREAEVVEVGRDENAPPLPSHLVLWLT